MKRLLPRLLLVAVFSAFWTLAEAQAVARGGGGGGSSSSGSSSGSSSSGGGGGGGGSTSSSSGGGGSSYSPPPAPEHSYAPPRTPSHSGGSSGGGSYSGGSRTPSGGSSGTAGRRVDGGSTNSATAPTYARPDGSTAYNGNYAIPRQRTPGGGGRPPIYVYPPYYSLYPWGFGFFGYGYGLNYFYDPFYMGGLGYPGYGYGGYGYGGYGYPGGYGYYGGGDTAGDLPTYESNESARDREQDGPTGELRIKVKPREAKVIVDGRVMGVVDDFDGYFQKLSLTEGRHRIALQLDGYETLTFDVMIIAGQTVNYKGELHKLADVLKR
jgi:hypothetical protein